MGKIIKLKQSDLVKIVERTIKEGIDEIENDNDMENDMDDTADEKIIASPNAPEKDIQIGKGEDGKFYVVDVKSGEVLGVK